MPSPERTPYTLRELAEIHRAAQERLGLYAAVETLGEWTGVNLVNPSTAGNWFTNLFGTVRVLRRLSRLLAYRYYNLSRAMGAERAYSNPDASEALSYEQAVSLRRLYADLGEILADVADATALPTTTVEPAPTSGPEQAPVGDPGGVSDAAPTRESQLTSRLEAIDDELVNQFRALEHDFDEATTVPVDQHDWLDPDIEDDFEQQYRDLLDAELEALEKEIQALEREIQEDDDATFESEASDLRTGIARLGQTKSYSVAGITDTAVMQAGRNALEELGVGDRTVQGWMRVTGPTPCAFCAMLASRGPVYTTPDKAGYLFAFHKNCHCHVVPVFKTVPALSARDRFFYDSWRDEKTWAEAGPGKQDSLNQWRRWLTRAYREGRVPDQDVYGPARA